MTTENFVWLVGGGVVLGILVVFFIVRYFVDQHEKKLERLGKKEPDSGVLVRRMDAERGMTATGRFDRSFDRMIERTGLELTPTQALGIMLLTGIVVAAIFYLARSEPWLIIFGFVVGMSIVLTTYLVMQARYRRQLQDQIPETFTLLASSLRAGMSLEQAIMVVSEHGAKPLSKEFGRCAGQLALGLPVANAVEVMAKRLELLDINILASTIAMYQTTGGNLPLLLDRLAQGARDRNTFRGFLRSATALGRVTAMFFLGFVPVMLIGYALFQPEHIQAFFTSAAGWTMLGIAFGLQIIGALIIFRMLKIEF